MHNSDSPYATQENSIERSSLVSTHAEVCTPSLGSLKSCVTALAINKKFPKRARILSSTHYKIINRKGIRLFGEQIAINACQGKLPLPRLGITVSRKYGKAHDRNRFKRVVREAFRELSPFLPRHLELNVFPKSNGQAVSKQAVEVDLKTLVARLRDGSSL